MKYAKATSCGYYALYSKELPFLFFGFFAKNCTFALAVGFNLCGHPALPPFTSHVVTNFCKSSNHVKLVLHKIPGHFGPLSGRLVKVLRYVNKAWAA